MDFRQHVFISYTHIDNQTLANQECGWVTLLHRTLSAQLEMRLGEQAKIWRDDKLGGNDIFADEILAQFGDVALMVSILSPRYVRSEWCRREVEAFCEAAESGVGIEVARKSRIVKVLKLPVDDLSNLPSVFQKALGFPLYRSKDNVPIELDPAYGSQLAGDFNLGVAMLAQKLAETILLLRDNSPDPSVETNGKIVYIAESGWNLEPDRKRLAAELSGRGYTVVPDQSLPSREQECVAEIKKHLERCQLSVHLIGSQPGMIPNGPTQKSTDALQNELAAQESRSRRLRRVVWIPNGTKSPDSHHQQFIDALHSSEDVQFGADLVTDDFEAMKGVVLNALKRIENPSAGDTHESETRDPKLIYILCDRRDAKTTVELRKLLRTREFDPVRTLFDGDAATIRLHNEQLLKRCAAAIIYYGAGDEAWFRTTSDELERRKGRIPLSTFLGPPSTPHKEELIDEFGDRGQVIDGRVAISNDQLEQMIAKLRPAGSNTTGG